MHVVLLATCLPECSYLLDRARKSCRAIPGQEFRLLANWADDHVSLAEKGIYVMKLFTILH